MLVEPQRKAPIPRLSAHGSHAPEYIHENEVLFVAIGRALFPALPGKLREPGAHWPETGVF